MCIWFKNTIRSSSTLTYDEGFFFGRPPFSGNNAMMMKKTASRMEVDRRNLFPHQIHPEKTQTLEDPVDNKKMGTSTSFRYLSCTKLNQENDNRPLHHPNLSSLERSLRRRKSQEEWILFPANSQSPMRLKTGGTS